MNRSAVPILLLVCSLCFAATHECFGVLADAWHIPDKTSDLGFHMRNPEFELGTNPAITIHQGVQKFNNSYGTANQTGGTLYFKGLTQGVWSSTKLSFHHCGQFHGDLSGGHRRHLAQVLAGERVAMILRSPPSLFQPYRMLRR